MNNFKEINTKQEKKFLLEKIEIFNRIVKLETEAKDDNRYIEYNYINTINELVNLGIINSCDEINDLEKFLGNKIFKNFINMINLKLKYSIDNEYINRLYKYENRIKFPNENKKYKLVDLFCGAGGLSLGFIQEGVEVVLANDIEPICIETYKFNHPNIKDEKVIAGDLKEIVDNISDYIDSSIDLDFLVGGPPCQGFSSANQQRIIDDPRNELYKYFLKAVEALKPKVVVMENVKGMLRVADQVVEDYKNINVNINGKSCNYQVGYEVINSKWFSVAQSRERLIYIAIRSDIKKEKNISLEKIFDELLNIRKKEYNLRDALYGLPVLYAQHEKNKNEVDDLKSGYKITSYNCEVNDYINLINNNKKNLYLFNHKARFLNENNFEIYSRLNPGDDATDEKISDIMPYAHRNHCFKDKYYKLIPDKPCRTITAHLKMDGHSHIHPFQVRSLTPREAARIQSFPDDYFFLGSYLHTYMQIGNAVPPKMANGIAKILINKL